MFARNLTFAALRNFVNIEEIRKLQKECFEKNDSISDYVTHGPLETTNDSLFCPRTFDGYSCWHETPAGADAYQNCPGFVMGFDPTRLVYKNCSTIGNWSTHPDTDRSWTNYSTCIDIEDFHFRSMVNNLYIGGYAVSIIILLVSLFIFSYFRTLRCTRNTIHMHLFSALTINNFFWILWYKTVVNNADVVIENEAYCRGMHIVTHYFMLCTYACMLCESLHLHMVLVIVFIQIKKAMRILAAVAWGSGAAIMTAYAITRYLMGDTDRCWIYHSNAIWVIIVPVGISLVISLMSLVNVSRILYRKIRPMPNQNLYLAAQRTARSAIILIPLFGLQYLLIPFRPPPKTTFDYVYEVFSAIMTSFQGTLVSIMFCFTNKEVIEAIKNHFSRPPDPVEEIPMETIRVRGGLRTQRGRGRARRDGFELRGVHVDRGERGERGAHGGRHGLGTRGRGECCGCCGRDLY